MPRKLERVLEGTHSVTYVLLFFSASGSTVSQHKQEPEGSGNRRSATNPEFQAQHASLRGMTFRKMDA